MAKKVWVFTLDNQNITPKLEDFQGNTVNTPEKHFLYVADDNHPQLATDGSKPLYTSADGIIEMTKLNELAAGTPPPAVPNDTKFVSAKTTNDHTVEVTLSDNKITGGVSAEWEVKIGGTAHPVKASANVAGHPDTSVFLVIQGATVSAGDTVTVSHVVAGSGIEKFLDKPVTNNMKSSDTVLTAVTNAAGTDITLTTDKAGPGLSATLDATKFEVKSNGGAAVQPTAVTSSGVGYVTVAMNPALKKGETITISHTAEADGLAAFTDFAVTNNVA